MNAHFSSFILCIWYLINFIGNWYYWILRKPYESSLFYFYPVYLIFEHFVCNWSYLILRKANKISFYLLSSYMYSITLCDIHIAIESKEWYKN